MMPLEHAREFADPSAAGWEAFCAAARRLAGEPGKPADHAPSQEESDDVRNRY